jgi:hypothetical protein
MTMVWLPAMKNSSNQMFPVLVTDVRIEFRAVFDTRKERCLAVSFSMWSGANIISLWVAWKLVLGRGMQRRMWWKVFKYSERPNTGLFRFLMVDLSLVVEWSDNPMPFENRTNLSGFETAPYLDNHFINRRYLSCFPMVETRPFYYKEFSFYDPFLL